MTNHLVDMHFADIKVGGSDYPFGWQASNSDRPIAGGRLTKDSPRGAQPPCIVLFPKLFELFLDTAPHGHILSLHQSKRLRLSIWVAGKQLLVPIPQII